jgi:arylsulfatase A-like enzyme
VGIDRSIGALRQGLRDLKIERATLVWYCSDNGGLPLDPDAVGDLRGHKGDLFEGGIRVPGIIEWPGRIAPAVTDVPASTMDIFPTIVELLGLPGDSMLGVRDGESIAALFNEGTPKRSRPIPFRFQNKAAIIDGDYKLISTNLRRSDEWQLYDLKSDPGETRDLAGEQAERFAGMKAAAKAMVASVEASAAGADYPEGKVVQPPRSAFWYEMAEYEPHLETFFKRPEYSGRANQAKRTSKNAKRKR